MKKFTGRPIEPRDFKTYIDWLKHGDLELNNMVDFAVYGYPLCRTIIIEADGEPVLGNSIHPVLMMEALAPQPELAPRDEARALKELYRQVRREAVESGIAEVWLTCTDTNLHKFLEARGFKRVITPIFKMVVGGASDPLNEERPEGVRSRKCNS